MIFVCDDALPSPSPPKTTTIAATLADTSDTVAIVEVQRLQVGWNMSLNQFNRGIIFSLRWLRFLHLHGHGHTLYADVKTCVCVCVLRISMLHRSCDTESWSFRVFSYAHMHAFEA